MLYKKTEFKFFIVIACLMLGLIACKNKQYVESDEDVALYDTKEFLSFYERFSTDSLFQMQHIIFPLEGIRSLQDSLDVVGPDFKWEEDTWVVHGPFDDMNGQFNREFLSMKGIVIEKISDQSGSFSMERRFGRLSSGWYLIYYREMGKY